MLQLGCVGQAVSEVQISYWFILRKTVDPVICHGRFEFVSCFYNKEQALLTKWEKVIYEHLMKKILSDPSWYPQKHTRLPKGIAENVNLD